MHQGHTLANIGEVEGLFDRGVAAADHRDLFAAVEKPVTGGAGGNAAAIESGLALQPKPTRLGAGGDDHGAGDISVAAVAGELKRARREIDGGDQVLAKIGADFFGLGLHLLHQPRPLYNIGEARIVLHIGGDGQLPARLHAGHQGRRQSGARGVNGGG